MSTKLATKTERKVDLPKKWRVDLLNDDYTPFEFVAELLMGVFGKNIQEAMAITRAVHEKGRGPVGLYSYDEASTYQALGMNAANHFGHPLRIEISKEA